MVRVLWPMGACGCLLLLQFGNVASQRLLANQRRTNSVPQGATVTRNKLNMANSANDHKSWLDTISDKLFGEPKKISRLLNRSSNTLNRNLEYDREYETMNRRGGHANIYGNEARRGYTRRSHAQPSSTMPALLIFLLIIIVCVVVVWMEANYGILESLFRVISPDDESSSIEERLDKYGGSSKSKRDKKSKRKRKSKSKRNMREDDSDKDKEWHKSRKRKHRRKSSRTSKSLKKKKKPLQDSDDSSSDS